MQQLRWSGYAMLHMQIGQMGVWHQCPAVTFQHQSVSIYAVKGEQQHKSINSSNSTNVAHHDNNDNHKFVGYFPVSMAWCCLALST